MTTREEMIEKAQIYLHALGSVSNSSDAESERTADFALSVERAALAAAREALRLADDYLGGEWHDPKCDAYEEPKPCTCALGRTQGYVSAALRMLEPEQKAKENHARPG